jgi:hypothetical protein
MDSLRKEFTSPSTSFRGAPFWSWNDHLRVEELVRQVIDMKAHGMGGFFMHSREGLETPYMGADWLECIRETVKTAAETGMNAWLYDEDRWPSGYAGGWSRRAARCFPRQDSHAGGLRSVPGRCRGGGGTVRRPA